jgi:hypothetical protein
VNSILALLVVVLWAQEEYTALLCPPCGQITP